MGWSAICSPEADNCFRAPWATQDLLWRASGAASGSAFGSRVRVLMSSRYAHHRIAAYFRDQHQRFGSRLLGFAVRPSEAPGIVLSPP
jgi:hypothetical protein